MEEPANPIPGGGASAGAASTAAPNPASVAPSTPVSILKKKSGDGKSVAFSAVTQSNNGSTSVLSSSLSGKSAAPTPSAGAAPSVPAASAASAAPGPVPAASAASAASAAPGPAVPGATSVVESAEDDESPLFVLHTLATLAAETDPQYIWKYPILLVDDSVISERKFIKTLNELGNHNVRPKNIKAMSSYAIFNSILEAIGDEVKAKDIYKLFFTFDLSEKGTILLPVQLLFFELFGHLIFLSHLPAAKGKGIDIHANSFLKQFELIEAEVLKGLGQTQRSFFGLSVQKFKEGIQEDDEDESQWRGWWERRSADTFFCLPFSEVDKLEIDDFLTMISYGPASMMELMNIEREEYGKIPDDIKAQIKEFQAIASADVNVLNRDRNLEKTLLETITELRRTESRATPARFKTIQELLDHLKAAEKIAFEGEEGEEGEESKDDEEDEEEEVAGADGGESVASTESGTSDESGPSTGPRYTHGPSMPTRQRRFFEESRMAPPSTSNLVSNVTGAAGAVAAQAPRISAVGRRIASGAAAGVTAAAAGIGALRARTPSPSAVGRRIASGLAAGATAVGTGLASLPRPRLPRLGGAAAAGAAAVEPAPAAAAAPVVGAAEPLLPGGAPAAPRAAVPEAPINIAPIDVRVVGPAAATPEVERVARPSAEQIAAARAEGQNILCGGGGSNRKNRTRKTRKIIEGSSKDA